MARGVAGGLALLVVATLQAQARGGREVVELDAARILIEVNATDGDSGVQVFLDGEGWKRMTAIDPTGRRAFQVKAKGGVGETGITEFFFESAEPSFDELPLEEMLARFPEGEYVFRGETLEGDRLEGSALLTHAIPAGPVLVAPEEDSVVDPTSLVVVWDAVPDPPGSRIVEYQVIVERADLLRVFDVHVPATVTSLTVSPEFLEPGRPYKFEVLAIEESGNQTLSESTFDTSD